MDTTPYTKREMDEHFEDTKERFDSQDVQLNEIKTSLKSLDTKVGIQNGRVGKLESKWTGVVMGGAVAVFLLGIIMSLGVYSFNLKLQTLHDSLLLEVKDMKI